MTEYEEMFLDGVALNAITQALESRKKRKEEMAARMEEKPAPDGLGYSDPTDGQCDEYIKAAGDYVLELGISEVERQLARKRLTAWREAWRQPATTTTTAGQQ